ncbi:hypothetical protein GMPD_13740 [Geomonas paludis]|uniref:Uncharacterized protein n=1 Tax=Geomonas paludis TaxID=2740185 RepID=A0A6V8MTG9_9BACT|nr:hypothetical protein GMPD_13740 [Geomonas paludis]
MAEGRVREVPRSEDRAAADALTPALSQGEREELEHLTSPSPHLFRGEREDVDLDVVSRIFYMQKKSGLCNNENRCARY